MLRFIFALHMKLGSMRQTNSFIALRELFFLGGGGGGGGWQESRTSPRVIYNVLLILSVFAGTRYLLSTKIKVIVRIVSQFTITFIQGRSTLLALQIFLLNKILFFLLPWLY